MIVCVTANAAIDRTLHVARLRPGTLHRVERDHAQAGGKGVNVARTLQALGRRVHVVVVIGGESGQWILRDLELAGLRASVVHAPGESRTCLEIVEEGGVATQLHGVGVDGGGRVGEHLVHVVGEAARGARWVALCGSLPAGMPPRTAAEIVHVARGAGARVAVDTRGRALAAAAAGSDLVRVNREEAEGASLAPRSGGALVVSDGAASVTAWDGSGRRFRATPPRVALRNPVGCGDAMMAALLAGLEDDLSFESTLRSAIALGAAQAEAPWPGGVDPARGRELERAVRWNREAP